ncbi:MAG: PEP-CTERM sorting domain-containing protein [Phycisphaeraceae bacterium]
MKPRTAHGGLLLAAIACALFAAPTRAAIVFDSLSGTLYTGSYGGIETGDAITLAGTERAVTGFDFRMRVNTGAQYYFSIYDIDAGTGLPDNLLWQSPLQTWTGPFSPVTVITVPVPNVVVPDDIALTHTNVSGQTFYLNSDLPTTGSTSQHVLRGPPTDPWTGVVLSFGIGATIYADPVPEPASLALLGLGALLIARRRQPSSPPPSVQPRTRYEV